MRDRSACLSQVRLELIEDLARAVLTTLGVGGLKDLHDLHALVQRCFSDNSLKRVGDTRACVDRDRLVLLDRQRDCAVTTL
jgi:hypothetical protein